MANRWAILRVLIGIAALATTLSACVSVGVGFDTGTAGVRDVQSAVVNPKVATPEVAGGLTRDHVVEAKVTDLFTQYRSHFPTDAVDMASLVYAVYHQPTSDIVFIGGTVTQPAGLLAMLRGRPGQQPGADTEVDPGPGGGTGICTQAPNSGGIQVPACAWVTDDSFGQLIPLVPINNPVVPSAQDLAALMRRMRPDLTPS